jgi:Pentapeptide repeats (8 copies)
MSAVLCLMGAGCMSPLEQALAPAPEGLTEEVEETTHTLSGDNLAGTNLAGANLSGSNLAGTNLAGANMGGNNLSGSNLAGTNLSGTNLAGNNLAGTNLSGNNLSGANLAGTNLAGANLAGTNLSGSNLSGSNLAGTNLAGNNLSGTNLSGTNLSGSNSGFNVHNLPGGMTGMLYSGEDTWGNVTQRCVVMGIGSTAFAKLLGQQSPNATMYVALGKLPWGFASATGGSAALKAWEAVVWGNNTYCSFVLVAPPEATWAGVAGFIKAVFRWQAPPSQSMQISGIEASAPYDSSLSTSTLTYTGMMNAAAQWKLGKITDKSFVAGEVAFVSATTNNQSVMVDFASWVDDSTKNGLILGHVQGSSPPTRAESVYYAVDNGDGTVSVKIAAAASGLTTISDTFEALNAAWSTYQDSPPAAKPIPRRCGGALYLNYFYGEPVPAGKCDDGLSWGNASNSTGSRKWSTVAGTTGPMNQYMLLPANASTPLMRGATADDLKVVLSETYVHTWDAAFDGATGLTVIDDSTRGTGLNRWYFAGASSTVWKQSTSTEEAFNSTNSYEGVGGKYATFAFQGTYIQLYLVKDPNHGITAVSLDGGPETIIDLYNKTRKGYQLMWSASNLTPGVTHSLKVRVTGTKNTKSTGYNTSIDAAVVSSAVCTSEPDSSFCARQAKNCGSVTAVDNCGAMRTVAFCGSCSSPQTCGGSGEDNVCGNGDVVDDRVAGTSTNQFEYYGSGWTSCYRCGNGSLYNSSKSESSNSSSYAKFRFNGVRIKLYGIKGPTHGIGAVSIDGGAETSVDFYNATTLGDQLVWTSPMLAYGSHYLKVRVSGSKNSSASGYYVVPDRVAVSASATCTVESNTAFCARLARNCGSVSGTDNCGNARTVSSCGSCSFGQTCDSGVCSSSASNLFSNPSFTGGTGGWTTWFASGCAGSIAGVTTAQDGDSKGAKVTIGSYSGTAWDNAQIFQVKTANGSPYTLRAYFQKAEGTSKIVTVHCNENGGTYASYGSSNCTNSSGWTSCSVTCDPPSGKSVKFGISVGSSNVDTFIDNMSLTQ